jgi:hypothetical protein
MRIQAFAIILLLIGTGCYGPKKAQRQIDKAMKKEPEVLARSASRLFPVKSDTLRFTEWRTEIDSIISVIERRDTISEICPDNTKEIRYIRQKIASAPPVYRVDSALIFAYSARIGKLTEQRDKFKKRAQDNFTAATWILILLLLSLIVHLLKRK